MAVICVRVLQFVPDEDVGVLNLAPRININYNIENLPNEVLEQIFKIVLMSTAIVFAGNACHAYQKLCGVNKQFRVVTRNLSTCCQEFISAVESNSAY